MRVAPLALAAGLLFDGGDARAQSTESPASLEPSRRLQPAPRGDAAKQTPIILRAREVRARPDLDAVASGDVDFRHAGITINADLLSYDQAEDRAVAKGQVRIANDIAIYTGPELQLRVQRFEGFFLAPRFEFTQLGAGGRADRIDFIDASRATATNASYTSCPRDGPDEPDWVLKADEVRLDLDANEGIAEGAVLRFLGAPILALPTLSFPLSDERKSGWLPPGVNFDSRSGLELSQPYYWNIAPNRDATLTPHLYTKRGIGVDGEMRYLEPRFNGEVQVGLLPNDRVANHSREAMRWRHEGAGHSGLLRYGFEFNRVSDDEWWKDFPGATGSLTPRLLSSRAMVERSFESGAGLAYARLQNWQVLQGSDSPVTPPYQRSPQVGVRWGGPVGGGVEFVVEAEVNRFRLPSNGPPTDVEPFTGIRAHSVGAASLPVRGPGWWVVPRVAYNAADYRTDQPMANGRYDASRFIPTASIDAGLEYERHTEAFGQGLRQTLEPRLLYVNTPFRAQSTLPNFDAAAKAFNITSIYSENTFAGVDRVSDAHLIAAGVTSRMVDERTGAEALRLGIVQRYLFRDQLVTAKADGTPDGEPQESGFGDLLLLGSTNLVPKWWLDGEMQYSPEISRSVRSIIGVRYSPGPFRTVNATYRFARGLSEQVELGWQWPVYKGDPSRRCSGSWYSVGRVNYSLRDSRATDAIFGAEYDAGCWIGRFVVEHLSTGRSEATTRLQLQLELVGLSRIGSNPLKVLKDNIPGYRLLRDDPRATKLNDE